MSNLMLCTDIPDPTTRLRQIQRVFPGALPYVVRSGAGAHYYPSQEAASLATGVESWVETGCGAWVSSDGLFAASFGVEDWPPDEVSKRVMLVCAEGPPGLALYDMPARSSGNRLREVILGVSREDYFRRFYRRSLCTGNWSAAEARERAAQLLRELPRHTLVLIGRRVQAVFGLRSHPLPVEALWAPRSDTMEMGDRRIVRMPCPHDIRNGAAVDLTRHWLALANVPLRGGHDGH
jgi:hypothetical protein